MHKRPALVIKAPQLSGDEFAVSREESGRSGGLVLVERLAFRIGCRITRGADVVELEIGVSFNLNNAIMRSQARERDKWLSRGFGGDGGILTLLA
jgi:hypothetical protein